MKKHHTISRRKLLATSLGTGALAASSAFPKPAIASGRQEWKMAMTWQKVLPGLGTGAVRLAKRITALTQGRVTVKPFGGGELVPPLGVFDAVSQGTLEMAHSAPYYWLNKHPATAFFCTVPGGLTAQEQNAWLYFGGGQKLWDEVYADFNLKALPAGNTGAQMGGWYKKEIKTVSDFQGLKIRMPGLAGKVVNELGASAQTISPQDLYTSMQSGLIDALEWVGPWNDLALGFHKVSDYYYGPGFHEGGATLELMINREKWDGLSKEMQRLVKIACATENDIMLAQYTLNNVRSYRELKQTHQVDIRQFPDAVQQRLFQVSQEVVSEVKAGDALAKKVYESYSNFRANAISYAPVSEYGFMRGRML